jgi:glycine hydroxymethyltransferase
MLQAWLRSVSIRVLARANEALEKKVSSAVFPGIQGGPLMHIIAAKAVAFKEAMDPEFRRYQERVLANARAMAETIISRGYKVVSGGTDNHLFLIDLVDKGLTGKAVDAALSAAHITVNKNAVPNDPQSPFVTSGIRVGTPAVTTRGFGLDEVRVLASWMCDVMDAIGDDIVIARVRAKVTELCGRHPVYAA